MSDVEQLAIIIQAASDPSTRERMLRAVRPDPAKTKPITTREVAKRLECCPRTVLRYARAGILHPRKVGPRRIRFDPAEIELLAHGAPVERPQATSLHNTLETPAAQQPLSPGPAGPSPTSGPVGASEPRPLQSDKARRRVNASMRKSRSSDVTAVSMD